MTTMEAVETKTCPTCHGHGVVPVTPVNTRQRKLLNQLTEAGERRAQYSAGRTLEAVTGKNKAYADIRKLAVSAAAAGLTKVQVADAVGLSRAALHNILSGAAGD